MQTIQAVGARSHLAFVEETEYGVTPAAPTLTKMANAIYGESLAATYEELMSNQITGNRARSAVRQGNQTVSGKVPLEASVANIATLLKHTLGAHTSTGAGPYSHVFKRGALPVGLTLEKWFADISKGYKFTGCRVNSMTLQVGSTGLVTGDIDFMGREMTTLTAPLGTLNEGAAHKPLAHHEATVKIDGLVADVMALNLTITNGLAATQLVGSRFAAGQVEGVGDVTGQITLMFSDLVAAQNVINETEHSLAVKFSNEDGSLEFSIPSCRFLGDPVAKIASDKGVTLVLNIRGIYNAAAASDLVVTVVSSEATV